MENPGYQGLGQAPLRVQLAGQARYDVFDAFNLGLHERYAKVNLGSALSPFIELNVSVAFC